MRVIIGILKYIWALPTTTIGLTMGLFGLLSGGSAKRHGCVFEFHGGFVGWFLSDVPRILFGQSAIIAMTFGYTILGRTQTDLNRARAHELVHVEQNGRWGPFFIPVYAFSSIVQRLKGNNPYRDNFLEVEAYSRAPIGPTMDNDEAVV